MEKIVRFFSILVSIFAILFLINALLDLLGIRIISFRDSYYILSALVIIHYFFFSLKQGNDIIDLKKKIKELEKGKKENEKDE